MTENRTASPEEWLPALPETPSVLDAYYGQLEASMVLSPREIRNLAQVAEAIQIDMDRGEIPLSPPPDEAPPTHTGRKPRRIRR